MKFQMLTRKITAGSNSSQCPASDSAGSTCSGHNITATASNCTANLARGDKGRRSSARPIIASKAVPAARHDHSDAAGAADAKPRPTNTATITNAMPMPPPRGVATGVHATPAGQVEQAPGTARSAARPGKRPRTAGQQREAMPVRTTPGRVIQSPAAFNRGLMLAPVLAARALPMVRARAEAAARAAVAGGAHDQLVGDLLEDRAGTRRGSSAGFSRLRSIRAASPRTDGRCCSWRARNACGRGDAFLALDHAGPAPAPARRPGSVRSSPCRKPRARAPSPRFS